MNTLVTSTTTKSPDPTKSLGHGPEGWQDFTQITTGAPSRCSPPTTTGAKGVHSDQTRFGNIGECTYETYEIEEPKEPKEAKEREEAQETHEAQETEESEETKETEEPTEPRKTNGLEKREEKDTLGPKLWGTIDEAIFDCRVPDGGDVNRPLFMLAHKVRSIEEELNVHFSTNLTAAVVRRWQAQNHDHLENDHDYLTEFLDKLSLVRFPQGRALARAVEIARGLVPPKQTMLLPPDVQLLASLCSVLQRQAGNKPFFLDGRSAAKALGKPHETVASWLRALRRLEVIRLTSQGRRGTASRYLYLANPVKH